MSLNIPTLFFIQGFLGAGKTTYAAQLAAETGALCLNADAYCAATFSEDALRDWDRCFSLAIDALWRTAAQELVAGKSVILDFGFWDRQSRDYARAQAQRLGVRATHIFVTADDDILKARISKRSGPVADKNRRDFDRLKSLFEPPFPDENALVVDTARADGRAWPSCQP